MDKKRNLRLLVEGYTGIRSLPKNLNTIKIPSSLEKSVKRSMRISYQACQKEFIRKDK
jgi:hypothetical protein